MADALRVHTAADGDTGLSSHDQDEEVRRWQQLLQRGSASYITAPSTGSRRRLSSLALSEAASEAGSALENPGSYASASVSRRASVADTVAGDVHDTASVSSHQTVSWQQLLKPDHVLGGIGEQWPRAAFDASAAADVGPEALAGAGSGSDRRGSVAARAGSDPARIPLAGAPVAVPRASAAVHAPPRGLASRPHAAPLQLRGTPAAASAASSGVTGHGGSQPTPAQPAPAAAAIGGGVFAGVSGRERQTPAGMPLLPSVHGAGPAASARERPSARAPLAAPSALSKAPAAPLRPAVGAPAGRAVGAPAVSQAPALSAMARDHASSAGAPAAAAGPKHMPPQGRLQTVVEASPLPDSDEEDGYAVSAYDLFQEQVEDRIHSERLTKKSNAEGRPKAQGHVPRTKAGRRA